MFAALIYPHQLFWPHPALDQCDRAVLIEDPLLFTQYRFHRQKLLLHRASMISFAAKLRQRKIKFDYIDSQQLTTTQDIGALLRKANISAVRYVDPNDDWLGQRLAAGLREVNIAAEVLPDPHFLTPSAVVSSLRNQRGKLFFTSFYIAQRQRLGILLETDGKPVGGRWTFDTENRKRLPKQITIPDLPAVIENEHAISAREYVRREFPQAVGIDAPVQYPIDHETAAVWLERFLQDRLPQFGAYEDAMSRRHDGLFHSVLTPMLNIGLLSPRQVVEAALRHHHRVPINSLEGIVRQIIGWREYVRLVYMTRGRRQRTRNFWAFTRPMPPAFYDGTTGIEPVDHVIRRVLRTGYCHHIERLMILGNFMLLCEIHPDAVYQWFMEMFVDAYDWVMVPNVYGMSQYADGGGMTTKPYISGSSYVLKMSDFRKGPWCAIWDALYWRFIDRHAEVFARNPRMAMMVRLRDRMQDNIDHHRQVAEEFLTKLHGPSRAY
jgi:deoxyribodipyrimidine photolyase-related protein